MRASTGTRARGTIVSTMYFDSTCGNKEYGARHQRFRVCYPCWSSRITTPSDPPLEVSAMRRSFCAIGLALALLLVSTLAPVAAPGNREPIVVGAFGALTGP